MMWGSEEVHEYMMKEMDGYGWTWKKMIEDTGRSRHDLQHIWDVNKNHPKRIERRYQADKQDYFNKLEKLKWAENNILHEDYISYAFTKTEGKIAIEQIKELLKQGKSPQEIVDSLKS